METESTSPQQSDEDIVTVTIKVYNTSCEDKEPTAFLVGERGMYYPKHESSMVWLPKGLVLNMTAPADDGTQQIQIPRWLATKKGLKYRD